MCVCVCVCVCDIYEPSIVAVAAAVDLNWKQRQLNALVNTHTLPSLLTIRSVSRPELSMKSDN